MAAGVTRVRLDELLVRRGHVASREKARALVLTGRVTVAGISHAKPGRLVPADVAVDVRPGRAYASRGGVKLAHALDRFAVDPAGRVCADLGASTGGFTDCLLQRGAERVFAVDVGYGQLDWQLRNDARVVVLDRTNARYLERLPETVSVVTVDVSFISLRLILPAARRISQPGADIVALVKPQFEAGRSAVGRGGVVRDGAVHRSVLVDLCAWLQEADFQLKGITASPVQGGDGNIEFLAHVRWGGGPSKTDVTGTDVPGVDATDSGMIDGALAEATQRFSHANAAAQVVRDRP